MAAPVSRKYPVTKFLLPSSSLPPSLPPVRSRCVPPSPNSPARPPAACHSSRELGCVTADGVARAASQPRRRPPHSSLGAAFPSFLLRLLPSLSLPLSLSPFSFAESSGGKSRPPFFVRRRRRRPAAPAVGSWLARAVGIVFLQPRRHLLFLPGVAGDAHFLTVGRRRACFERTATLPPPRRRVTSPFSLSSSERGSGSGCRPSPSPAGGGFVPGGSASSFFLTELTD